MDERMPEFRSAKNAPSAPDTSLHRRNVLPQARHQSSSSSPPSSSDLHSGSSKASQARGTLRSGAVGQGSGKGKKTSRHTTSKSTTMGYHSSISREDPMVQVPILIDPAGEVSYTPTTHRISKAKKGKKVHACEYGCGKVFTRAEHRKRHEANHLTEALYRCQVEECRKPFQRGDLLTRHLERQHGIQQPSGSSTGRRQRTSSPASSVATSSQAHSPMTPALSGHPYSSGAGSGPLSSATMSIGSIIEPNMRRACSHPDQAWNQPYQMPIAMAPRHFPPDLVFGLSASDDSPLYSSDSCYSPISEAAHSQVHPQSYLPRYDKALASTTAYPIDYHSQMATPIPMLPSYGPWTGLEGNSRSGTGLGLAYEEPYPTSVGISQSASITHEHPVDSLVEPTTPKALAFVERSRGDSLRARPTFATGLVASKHNLVNLDDETMSHYLACYWEHFHPQFPIVHKPSPPLTETRSVLNTILLAIGAQFSTRPHAKLHSTSWFSFAARSCAILDTVAITSRSPISNLQAIVLLEILSLYRSRSSGVYKSVQFEALYSKLSNDSEQSEANITAYVQKIPKNANVAFLRTANRHWADLEARRRILLAAFVIDTQRTIFFQQPPCQTSIMPDRNLPVPCSEEAFECADVSSWFTLLFQPRSSSLSTFQQSILQSCQIHTHSASIFTGSPPSNLSLHALSMATRAPIPSLLTVAAESWLFSRKVETPAEWANAKIQLRNWVHGDEASKAVWHAGHVLRAYFARQKDEPISGLHELWSLYLAAMVCWAYGFSVLPHLQQANQSAEGYLASLDLPSWKDVESVRGAGGTQNVLASVRARLKGKGNGALITEGERVLERLIEGRGRLCWF